MRGFHHHFVTGQHALGFYKPFRFLLIFAEMAEQHVDVGQFEVVTRLFDFILMVDVAVGDAGCPGQVEHRFDVLQVHRQAFETVGDFAEHRFARQAADFLEVGELGDFHAVQPDFPAQTPGTQRRRFPVIFDKADVMHFGVDAQRAQRIQIQFLDVGWRRFEHDLILVVVLQTVGVVAITTVFRAA